MILVFLDSQSYKEVPIEIFDWQVHWLRTMDVTLVKVLWKNHMIEKATWEAEEDMNSKYPFLFSSLKNHA